MPKKDTRSYAQRADYLKRAVTKRRKKILVRANCHREIHAGMTQLPLATKE